MSQFLGREGGSTLRVDVYPRYPQAVEDRPITTQVKLHIPDSEAEIRESVERFWIFGDDVHVPAEFASVSVDDPLTGTSGSQPMSVQIWTPNSTKNTRVRFIVSKEDGERIASASFTVKRLTQGVGGKGFTATLESDSKLITVVQTARTDAKATDKLNSTFNFSVNWEGLVASSAIADLEFAEAMRSPHKLIFAHEFTGPFLEILSFESSQSIAPRWLVTYARALADLQDYANVPLRLIAPPDDDPAPIEHAVRVASLLHARIIGQRSPIMGVNFPGIDLGSIVDRVNAEGKFEYISTFDSDIANGHVTIPDARFMFADVTAGVGAVEGVEQLLLRPSGSNSDVTLRVCLNKFVSDD